MNSEPGTLDKRVHLGGISGVHGIRGWVKIHSHTDPRTAIFEYQPWQLDEEDATVLVLEHKVSGKSLLARIKNVDDRDAAEALVGSQIYISRSQLPETGTGEFYWTDLVGLTVENQDGINFGKVRDLLATGANDVMVVEGERQRLIPFVMDQFVSRVDLEQGVISVDWDPEF